jgi:hypothetical protein
MPKQFNINVGVLGFSYSRNNNININQFVANALKKTIILFIMMVT